jgi:hypothetical protein
VIVGPRRPPAGIEVQPVVGRPVAGVRIGGVVGHGGDTGAVGQDDHGPMDVHLEPQRPVVGLGAPRRLGPLEPVDAALGAGEDRPGHEGVVGLHGSTVASAHGPNGPGARLPG